jgi:membrane dipeptidase
MFIIDAHLDLAYNALRGRDVLRPAADQMPDEEGIASVGLPDLRAGHVGLICATIFCEPALIVPGRGYTNADEAHAMAQRQFDWYQRQASDGNLRLIQSAAELPSPDREGEASAEPRLAGRLALPNSHAMTHCPLDAILLLEGADPLRGPADISPWFDAGLRIVGLAWKQTRYAGGTGAPGPLTAEGVALVHALDEHRIIHDISHLAEESFWQLLDLSQGPIMASHSNCRAIVPTDRQLSDEMIRALVSRGGVIGINFFDRFLLPPDEYGTRRATLADIVRHIRHVCDLAGDARHVAIGTDMDGGFGRERLPVHIVTSADLPKLAETLAQSSFSPQEITGILGGNWLRFFSAALLT